MAIILPPKTNAGAQTGERLGRALSEGIQQGGNIAFQRNLLNQGLEGLENLPAGTTPAQLAALVIKATRAIPGGERYAGTLFNSLLPTLQANQKAAPETAEALASLRPREGIETIGGQNQGIDFNTEVKELLGEKFFPNIQPHVPTKGAESLKPLKPLTPPHPIGPAEESSIRNLLRRRGITDPAVQDELIAKQKQYQNDVYAAQKERFSNLEQYQNARRDRDNAFFAETAEPLQSAHGKMSATENALWKEMSRKYEDLPSPARYASTEKDFNALVSDPLSTFKAGQKGPPYGSADRPKEIKKRLEDARTSVQDHLKRIEKRTDITPEVKGVLKQELRDKYTTLILEKDFGVAQAAYATRDISDKFVKSVPKLPFRTSFVQKVNDKQIYDLANALGSSLQKDDSLVRARDEALHNNYDDASFNQALNLAVNSGRLELSDAQAAERNDLSIPQQLDLDSIFEGLRSWKDAFKGKK